MLPEVRAVARETILRLWDPATLPSPRQKNELLARVALQLHRKGLRAKYTRRDLDKFLHQHRHKRKKRNAKLLIKVPRSLVTQEGSPVKGSDDCGTADPVVQLAAAGADWITLQHAFDAASCFDRPEYITI